MLQSTGMAIAGEGSHAFDYYEDHDYWAAEGRRRYFTLTALWNHLPSCRSSLRIF
jgi:hypothetical protein